MRGATEVVKPQSGMTCASTGVEANIPSFAQYHGVNVPKLGRVYYGQLRCRLKPQRLCLGRLHSCCRTVKDWIAIPGQHVGRAAVRRQARCSKRPRRRRAKYAAPPASRRRPCAASQCPDLAPALGSTVQRVQIHHTVVVTLEGDSGSERGPEPGLVVVCNHGHDRGAEPGYDTGPASGPDLGSGPQSTVSLIARQPVEQNLNASEGSRQVAKVGHGVGWTRTNVA